MSKPEYPHIAGELEASLSLEDLLALFKNHLNCEIRFSSHFTGGSYFIIREKKSTNISFEKINTKEFLISGESDSNESLIEICGIISSVLAIQLLKHRLELENADGNDIAYLHFKWER